MRARDETPACQSRLLHLLVKAFRAEMREEGFDDEASYMVLLNVVMRIAFEEDGESGVERVLDVVERMAQGMERPNPQLKVV